VITGSLAYAAVIQRQTGSPGLSLLVRCHAHGVDRSAIIGGLKRVIASADVARVGGNVRRMIFVSVDLTIGYSCLVNDPPVLSQRCIGIVARSV
jgi:hypothetical protein